MISTSRLLSKPKNSWVPWLRSDATSAICELAVTPKACQVIDVGSHNMSTVETPKVSTNS